MIAIPATHCSKQCIKGFMTMHYINLRFTYLLTYNMYVVYVKRSHFMLISCYFQTRTVT